MGLKIYLNGEFVDQEEAKVSVFDHGFLYGDGVFEGIRLYNGRVFRLKEHIDRLYEGAHTICLNIKETKEEMTKVVTESCRINGLKDAYIRLVVSRGKGDLGLDPKKCPVATSVCIAAEISLYPPELYEKGLSVATVATRRNPPESCNPRVKSLNYLNNIYAKIEANMMGVGEAIFLNEQGYVVEATADNIFIMKNGVLYTPPVHLGGLNGITRTTVMELAAKRGIKVEEALMNRMDLYNADEFFLTGTAAEIIPVTVYDNRTIADGKPGAITKQLIADYKAYTQVDGEVVVY